MNYLKYNKKCDLKYFPVTDSLWNKSVWIIAIICYKRYEIFNRRKLKENYFLIIIDFDEYGLFSK